MERYGCTFELPKDAIIHNLKGEEVTIAEFRGAWLRVEEVSADRDWPLTSVVSEDKRAQRLLGKQTLDSKFELMQAALSATPDQVKWWRFRSSQNERAKLLLLVKFSVLLSWPHASIKGPIYFISSGSVRGYQLGDPNVPPYETHLDLFDATGRHLALDAIGPSGHGQLFNQEEIDAIVASIQPRSQPLTHR